YSQRTTAVNVTLTAAAANDGAAGENDDIGGALATQDVENVNGGSGDDVLVGDSVGTVTNTFNGNAGDDVIDGMGGADNESGDAGYDYFVQSGTTANGSDIMQGGADADIVDYSSRTGAITVSLDGTATANDGVGGAAEGDKVVAEDVIGGSAGDTITGDAERNILEGGGGVDTLLGAGDRDFLVGGPGGDTLNGGTGKDGVSYHTATSGLTIDLTPGPGSGEAFNDVYTNIDIVLGSNFDDVIRDNANDNMVSGGDGNDTITGNGGNDVLLGGAGSDILRGGADKDNLNAGEGADSDVLVGGAGTRDMINYSTCGAGVTIDLSLGGTTQGGGGDGAIGGAGDQNTGGCGTDDISDAEYIRGSYFDDVLTGDANSNNIFGAAGADSLVGRAANDNLYGGPGIDNVIDGGAGDDECIGGDGETAVGCEEVGVVDTTPPPVPTITSSPTNPSSSTDASFSFTDTEPGVSFECQLDGGAFTSCTSSHNYSGLGSGSHTFGVRARDAAGNTSAAATYTWTIELGDTTPPPVPTITSNPTNPSSSPNASFGFTDTEPGVTFECQLDGGAFATCTSTRDYSGLAAGSHTFGLRARDAAGNTSAAATYTWTINPCAEVSMVGGNNFSPNAVTISVGCSVRWTNTVNTTHTTTSDPAGTWDSGNMANGATFSRQFATAGTYNYRCTIHASMTGTITVQP
ncbi:MAG: plastocyanin/azurin family copper-binding protein, partial [Actinomycetota bacterium]